MRSRLVLPWLTCLLVVTPLMARQETPAVRPATAPAGGPVLLPEVKFTDVPLAQVLDYLREADPTFQVVCVGPAERFTTFKVAELKLRNVTAATALKALVAAADERLSLNTVSSDFGATIWKIETHLDSADASQMTSVYRLREKIDALTNYEPVPPEERAKALETILSLVQTALDIQADAPTPVTMKVHQATETLIFRGTAEQSALVAETLANVVPSLEQQREARARAQGIDQASRTARLIELRCEQIKLKADAELKLLKRELEIASQSGLRGDQMIELEEKIARVTRQAEIEQELLRMDGPDVATTRPTSRPSR